jgi:hypothetical protein
MSLATNLIHQRTQTIAVQKFPALDPKQVGVLRRYREIISLPDGDYSGMIGPWEGMDFACPRFQLFYSGYALAMAHYHRLPAAPGLFKPLFDGIIRKVLRQEHWIDWHDVSRGGGWLDTPACEGWVDPVVKDNIMYSAYIQVLTLMHNVMFDDDRFREKGAITFKHHPLAWGPKNGFKFEYDQDSLSEVIYWQMVQNGYLGVACEPYCVYQICNQPPILGFRLQDHLNGTSRAQEITDGYTKAWEDVGGIVDAQGSYTTVKMMHTGIVVPGVDIWSDAWHGTLMHAWNPDFVKSHYPAQRDKWTVRGKDGALSVKLAKTKLEMPEGVPQLPEELPEVSKAGYNMGWMAVYASEVGDTETLEGFLTHADRYLDPTWSSGGAYYYPRRDDHFGEDGNVVVNHPYQGSILLGWARLNVPNGLHLFYKNPWGKEHFQEPALTGVADSLDLSRAIYDGASSTLFFDVARMANKNKKDKSPDEIELSRVFGRGKWVLTRDDHEVASGDDSRLLRANQSDEFAIEQAGETLKLRIGHRDMQSYVLSWVN